MSSSLTVTVTLEAVTSAYSPVPVTAWASVTASSTASRSSAVVTVTVCAVSQLCVVNVRLVGDGDTSLSACPLTATVTFAEGWVSRTTV